jgi:hypothetical protein
MTDQHMTAGSSARFFRARWHGLVSLDRLFWVDMVLVATALNIVTSFAAILVLGLKGPTWASILVYLSPLPYNIFLVVAVWRTTERMPATLTTGWMRTGSLLWLLVATLI